MIKNLTLNKTLFLTTGLISLVAAVMGVLDPGMYDPVVSARIMPGVSPRICLLSWRHSL